MEKMDNEIVKWLKNNIIKERNKLLNNIQFNPITNCILILDNMTYNIRTDDNKLLLIKLNMMAMSAKNLGMDISEIMISGYSLNDWITDIKNNLKVQEYEAKKRELDKFEESLNKLLFSEEQLK